MNFLCIHKWMYTCETGPCASFFKICWWGKTKNSATLVKISPWKLFPRVNSIYMRLCTTVITFCQRTGKALRHWKISVALPGFSPQPTLPPCPLKFSSSLPEVWECWLLSGVGASCRQFVNKKMLFLLAQNPSKAQHAFYITFTQRWGFL